MTTRTLTLAELTAEKPASPLALLLESATPATLVAMYNDMIDSQHADADGTLAEAIRLQLVVLVGEDEALAMLGYGEPEPVQNDRAVAAFIGHIAKANDYIDTIQQALDDHFDTLPEQVDWADVGSACHVADLLRDIVVFIGNPDDEDEDDADGYIDGYDGPSGGK